MMGTATEHLAEETDVPLSPSRRRLLLTLAGVSALAGVGAARAAYPLVSEDGSPIRNFSLPRDADILGVRGLQRFGADDADTALIEVFDYNCGYCRTAAGPLDALLREDRRLALVLLHSPILSPASVDVARIQMAVHRRHGLNAARALHLALMTSRGFLDAGRAMGIATGLGLDVSRSDVAMEADLRDQRATVTRLGFRSTPTFVLGNTAFIGWPGPKTISSMVGQMRSCGRLTCA